MIIYFSCKAGVAGYRALNSGPKPSKIANGKRKKVNENALRTKKREEKTESPQVETSVLFTHQKRRKMGIGN
jgi:hypothetical protein